MIFKIIIIVVVIIITMIMIMTSNGNILRPSDVKTYQERKNDKANMSLAVFALFLFFHFSLSTLREHLKKKDVTRG